VPKAFVVLRPEVVASEVVDALVRGEARVDVAEDALGECGV
jgi:hypothetical protein